MSISSHISTRVATRLAKDFLPGIVGVLVAEKIITEKHLADDSLLWTAFLKHRRAALDQLLICVALDDQFLKQSIKSWRRDDKPVAVLLYAIAAEQYMNMAYQRILFCSGWTLEQSTGLLRQVNIESKIGWMFEAFTKTRFPVELQGRLRRVIEIRNAIAHYKAEYAALDSGRDSYSKIEGMIGSLRRMSITRDFALLKSVFDKVLASCDPHSDLTMKATNAIVKARQRRLRTKRGSPTVSASTASRSHSSSS